MSLPEGYKSTAQCWREYPRLAFPENVGTRGTQQKRARNACIAASMRGQADPELPVGPDILRDPVALWRIKEPWSARPPDKAAQAARIIGRVLDPAGVFGAKTGGDTLRSTGEGWRPPMGIGMSRFREAERKATIGGGVDALAAVGLNPWVQVHDVMAKLKPMKLRGDDKTALAYMRLVQDAAQALGDPKPHSLTTAAEYVRAQVIEHRLEKAAWAARGLRMALAAQTAQKKRQIAETTASTALSTAGSAVTPIVPIGTIVGGVLLALGGAAAGASARTTVEQSRSKRMLQEYAAEFDFALQERNIRMQRDVLQQEIAKAEALQQALVPAAIQDGQKVAQIAQGVVWVGTVGVVTLGVYWVATKVVGRKK